MKTREQILEAVRNGKESQCIDRRDYERLAVFFDTPDLALLGVGLRKGVTERGEILELTEDTVKARLKCDVDFGFEKALDKRGLSSAMMHHVVKMWLWVLDDELQEFDEDNYAQYGLPLFKAVALKFGFPNPIGEDSGKESKYHG